MVRPDLIDSEPRPTNILLIGATLTRIRTVCYSLALPGFVGSLTGPLHPDWVFHRLPLRASLVLMGNGKRTRGNETEHDTEDSAVPLVIGDMELVPASVSAARAAHAMPGEPSEDASQLLEPPELQAPEEEPEETRDYGPGGLEWVVELVMPADMTVSTAQLDELFDERWRKQVASATLYGFSPEEGRWTYVHAGGVPTLWTKVAVGVDLVSTHDEDPKPLNATALAKVLRSVEERGKALSAQVRSRSTVDEGAALAAKLFDCWRDARGDCIAVLKAADGERFVGRQVWDVMRCLGLRWGDGDLFHWANDSEVGDDHFFSVWTSTEPGYFLPEAIAAGRMNPETLIFGFIIARCAAPEHVRQRMMTAIEYAQRRLGGSVVDEHGEPLRQDAALERVRRVVQRLAAAGLEPGVGTTLRLM